MDAKLYAMELRLSRTIEKYIEAVDQWGFPIDVGFEMDMIKEFRRLTAGPNQLHVPPMLSGPQIQAVQGSFARKRDQLADRLVREATNRLRELKMKKQHVNQATSITNNFNAPVGNAYINSSVVQTNNFNITTQQLQDVDRISEGNQELQVAALEIRDAQNQGVGILDKFQKWATLASTVTELADKVHQYYPQIDNIISQARYLAG